MDVATGFLIVIVVMLNMIFHAYRCGRHRGRDEVLSRWDAAIARAKAKAVSRDPPP
jgi:hypothetical protein